MNDKQLRQDVLNELEYEPSIDAIHIGVTAKDGTVTLTGHVASYPQKKAAERAAWRVKGVRAIAQDIEVHLPSSKKISDDEIAERAIAILAWSAPETRDAIRVKVANGFITLTGQVNWHYQRTAAELTVRQLSGVPGVINDIILAPAMQLADVRQRILDALKRHAEVEASRIHVDVHEGGTVEIGGEVDDWDEHRAIVRAVWSAPGVRVVEDRVRIC